jgi:uncharacterized tellurite resistance protein B-like protein
MGKREHASELSHDELHLAVAALLVEAAMMDGTFDTTERATIERLVVEQLAIEPEDAKGLIADAEVRVRDSVEMWGFANKVKNAFSYEDRVGMMEMLWQVVYADGVLHDYEANLMRRVAGLIYVEDRDSGHARKRALAQLGLEE